MMRGYRTHSTALILPSFRDLLVKDFSVTAALVEPQEAAFIPNQSIIPARSGLLIPPGTSSPGGWLS